MCGIASLLLKSRPTDGATSEAHVSACRRMAESLRHRGPDERTVTPLGRCILGHARLSIIDLVTGSQPLYNEDRSVAVILNGEIYNYRELRSGLLSRGHRLESASDTEVIAHLYEDLGERCFEQLNGMFAVAIWDLQRERLVLARDRMGEKPLLYAETPELFAFASELHAFRHVPGLQLEPDPDAAALYLQSMAVPAPYSMARQVRKLPPAHRMVIDALGVKIEPYWSPRLAPRPVLEFGPWKEQFHSLWREAVTMRMVSDVPLGVFLSGGIDSSAVTAFMSGGSSTPIKSFTVGFQEEIDERPFARQVAELYRTDHHELLVEGRPEDEVLKVLSALDEPFGDPSIVPTYLIARAARQEVTVILTGDGGDELFAGYPMYLEQMTVRRQRWGTALARAIGFPPYPREVPTAFARWHHVRSIVHDEQIAAFVPAAKLRPLDFYRTRRWLQVEDRDPLGAAFSYDLNWYLPDDLLKKVDAAAMLASLETRAPFLDHRLVEWAMAIPPLEKLRGGETKHLLKRFLREQLPASILNRAKQGFGPPTGAWLRDRLRASVLDLLATGCHTEQLVERRAIEAARRAVLDTENSGFRAALTLWMLLGLELWLRKMRATAD